MSFLPVWGELARTWPLFSATFVVLGVRHRRGDGSLEAEEEAVVAGRHELLCSFS
jgi:hypothetical protein